MTNRKPVKKAREDRKRELMALLAGAQVTGPHLRCQCQKCAAARDELFGLWLLPQRKPKKGSRR